LPEKEKIKYKLIGQLFDTYWLIEYDRNLYIMDQHAAHEKIKYEQLMRDFKNKEILSQQLMPPLVITVTYQERETVLEYYDLFMQIGYDIVEFGGNEFKINAVPSNLYGISEKALFMEFISSLMENSGYVSNDIFIRKLSTMACKSAIKGNTHITYQEADNLVKQLFELENPYTCPHGRPTIISMSEAEIEKKFRRIV
jgi:DNA mismatch repair protein MutL